MSERSMALTVHSARLTDKIVQLSGAAIVSLFQDDRPVIDTIQDAGAIAARQIINRIAAEQDVGMNLAAST